MRCDSGVGPDVHDFQMLGTIDRRATAPFVVFALRMMGRVDGLMGESCGFVYSGLDLVIRVREWMIPRSGQRGWIEVVTAGVSTTVAEYRIST